MKNRDVAKLMALIVMKDELAGKADEIRARESAADEIVKRYYQVFSQINTAIDKAYQDDPILPPDIVV